MALWTLCVVASVGPAAGRAEPPQARANRLVEEGAALGRAGRFEDAIAAFREADRAFPRAIHTCNIGLAYKLWGKPSPAHLYLALCVTRATEALPSWVERERAALARTLRRGDWAPVVVTSAPVRARVGLPGFVEGDFVTPLTVWLAPGEHPLRVTAAGYRPVTTRVRVSGRAEQRVSISLVPATVVVARDRESEQGVTERFMLEVPMVTPERGPWPWITLSLGLVAGGLGGAFHALAVDSKTEAERFGPGLAFDELERDFEVNRGLAIGAYALSAAALSVGFYLLFRPLESASEPEDVPGLGPP